MHLRIQPTASFNGNLYNCFQFNRKSARDQIGSKNQFVYGHMTRPYKVKALTDHLQNQNVNEFEYGMQHLECWLYQGLTNDDSGFTSQVLEFMKMCYLV